MRHANSEHVCMHACMSEAPGKHVCMPENPKRVCMYVWSPQACMFEALKHV